MVNTRVVDFVTEWMAHNLEAGAGGGSAALAAQLEIDAVLVGVTRADIEADMGPLEELIASARRSLDDASRSRPAPDE